MPRLPNPRDARAVTREAMVQSALLSAARAEELGLAQNRIILSAKVSAVQDLIAVYGELARRSRLRACISGSPRPAWARRASWRHRPPWACCCSRASATPSASRSRPEPGGDRTREVQVAQELLQTMGLRTFVPLVAACPGCGRTTSTTFQELARRHPGFHPRSMPGWKTRYPGVETLNVAVMGCIVNGPGESKHADIGISLPGTGEQPAAPVFIDGKKFRTLRGPTIAADFKPMVIDYIERRYGRARRRRRRRRRSRVAVARLKRRIPHRCACASLDIRLRCSQSRTIGRTPMSSLTGKHGPRYRHVAGEPAALRDHQRRKAHADHRRGDSGVDVDRRDDRCSNRTVDEIHRALAENLVIFFRDQHITPQQHLAFGRMFGELHVHPAAPHEPAIRR